MNAVQCSILAVAVCAISACAQPPQDLVSTDDLGPGDVAVVNGERIPESVYRLYALRSLERNADELSAEERERLIGDLVYLRVLASEAEMLGIPEERAIAAELELIRWQFLTRAATTRYRETHPPTETELRSLYEQNLANLVTTQFKARHILVDSEGEATELIEQLNGGADFHALANEHSKDGDGESGGDLGWLAAESMGEPLANAVRAMTPGSYSSTPVQTEYGWHVIMLDDSREQPAPGMESIRADLVAAVERENLDVYISTLRESANVEFR